MFRMLFVAILVGLAVGLIGSFALKLLDIEWHGIYSSLVIGGVSGLVVASVINKMHGGKG